MSQHADTFGAGSLSTIYFSTDDLPEADRLPVWREEFGRNLLQADIEPVASERLHAVAAMRILPGVRTLSFRGSAMCFSRRPEILASGDDSIGLVFSYDDGVRLSQRKGDLSLRAGDASVIMTDEPGSVMGRGHLGLLFPRTPMVGRVRNIADFAARRIPQERESIRLLVNYLAALPEKLTLASAGLRETLREHIYDLAALAICPERPSDENTLNATAAARLDLALRFIGKNFDNPDCTISAVARAQNVSPRYLQRLIETTGATFSEAINELRLQRAYELLTSRQGCRERISDIALRSGFSDVAHFNRSFRRRFGGTPTRIRNDANAVARSHPLAPED